MPLAAPKPVDDSTWKDVPLVPGATYLQLMSVEPDIARVVAEGLRTEGFNAITSPGISSGVARVLVGPLNETSMATIRAQMEARGLRPFVKVIPRTGRP